jgi:hypothetical protein
MSIFEKATALESKTRPKRHRYLPNELKIKKALLVRVTRASLLFE